jgi:hypothetical protein
MPGRGLAGGALPEVCGDAAVYFDPTSAEGIAQGIAEVLDRPPAGGTERAALFTRERFAHRHGRRVTVSWPATTAPAEHAFPLHHAADLRERVLCARRRGAACPRAPGLPRDRLQGLGTELRAGGVDARCLADVAAAVGEPDDLHARSAGSSRATTCRTSETSTGRTWACAGRSEAWSVARTVRTFRALERVFDDVRPGCSCPRSATRPFASPRT